MGVQEWAWLLFLLAQASLVLPSLLLRRAQDPRDRNGRKVAVDPTRVATMKRWRAAAYAFCGACLLAALALRVSDDSGELPSAEVVFGSLAVVGAGVSCAAWFLRVRKEPSD